MEDKLKSQELKFKVSFMKIQDDLWTYRENIEIGTSHNFFVAIWVAHLESSTYDDQLVTLELKVNIS